MNLPLAWDAVMLPPETPDGPTAAASGAISATSAFGATAATAGNGRNSRGSTINAAGAAAIAEAARSRGFTIGRGGSGGGEGGGGGGGPGSRFSRGRDRERERSQPRSPGSSRASSMSRPRLVGGAREEEAEEIPPGEACFEASLGCMEGCSRRYGMRHIAMQKAPASKKRHCVKAQFVMLSRSVRAGCYWLYCMGLSVAPDPGHHFLGQIPCLSGENEPEFLTSELLTIGHPLYSVWAVFCCDAALPPPPPPPPPPLLLLLLLLCCYSFPSKGFGVTES